MGRDEIRALERIAADATAASTVVVHEGWQLRASERAPFRRTSSVLALGPVADVDRAVAAAEAFYTARGLPTRFQVSPASTPTTLDGLLARRGYVIEAPVTVATATTRAVTAGTRSDREAVIGSLDEEWVGRYAAVHADDEQSRARVHAYGEMLRALPRSTAGALVDDGATGDAVALGFAVVDGEWTGIFGMGTRADARRSGAATAVLHALAAWADRMGTPRLYLQVEVDNPGARALYARAGFTEVYPYHYRTRDHDDGVREPRRRRL